jgi:hypothetical protein
MLLDAATVKALFTIIMITSKGVDALKLERRSRHARA